MDSEHELTTLAMERRKPRKLVPPLKNAPKNKQRMKNNRISSPEIESITESGTSDKTSNNSSNIDMFLARSKHHVNRSAKHISEDEISNISTLDSHRSETTAGTSEDISRSNLLNSSPKASESKTYRDKLKERFRSVKKQSSQIIEKSSIKKFKSKSQDVVILNKCIDNLKHDNHNVNLQLKAHKRYVYQGVGGEVSSAEKYLFFCESLPDTAIEPEGSDEIDKDNMNENVVVEKRAENMSELLIKSYEESVWSPKGKILTHELESANKDLADEGLFIAEPPKIPQRDLAQLKQRLLASGNNEFFDAAGKLKFEESNYSKLNYRPDRFDEINPFELTYHKPSTTVPAGMSSVVIKKAKPMLEINIQGFRFTNHPLFSPEHTLQENLVRHFDIHKEFRRNRKRDKLWERLQSLRRSQSELQQAENAAGDAHQDLDLSKIALTKQIKNIREEYYAECKAYRDNAKNVINAWKSLKQLRIDNGYSTTTIKLIISKHTESEGFYDDPAIALNELKAEKEEEYQEQLNNYKKELISWRKLQEDDELIDEEKPIKPPRIISAKKLRATVESMITESFGDSDEPIISFTVNYSHGITPSDQVNDEEKNRRKSVENTKMKLKLTLNNVRICKSKTCKLNPNFTLNFDEVLSLKLRETENITNENIDIQLIEEHVTNISKRSLGIAKVDIPRLGQLIGQTDFQEVYFNEQTIQGFLTFCIGWDTIGTNQDENKSTNILNAEGGLNIENLQHWIDTSNPDPEDPRNAIIFDYLSENKCDNSPLAQVESTKYFRCDPYLETFTICSKEDIENNVRLQLLRLRDKNEPEFVGMMVPNRLNEIPSNIFATYKRRLAEEKYQEYFDKEDEVDDDIISKRSLGRKYLRQIHTKVFQLCRNCENNLSFEDVIDEKMVPWIQNYLKTMLSNFINWFKIIPALTKPLPMLELRSEVECLNAKHDSGVTYGGTAKIVINLKSGINLPIPNENVKVNSSRKQSKSRSSTGDGNNSANSSKTTLIPQYFVEICCDNDKNEVITSGLSQGKQPTWNETLTVSLNSENLDYLNPNSLNGSIYINLFQLVEDDSDGLAVNLGSVVITIAAAVSENKLEGEFPLNKPPFIHGYEKEEEIRSPSTPRTQVNKNTNLSFLEMSVYVDSTVPKISADLGSITCGEPPFIKDHIIEWNKRFNLDHPRRKFSALAIDSNGKTICLTRFIKTLEPPKLNADEFDVNLEQCARFVSLIPFSKVNKFYENIWLTAEQTLKLGIGSIYDHATLLTCYLLSLKLEVWLLMGFGIPHGNTAYVLIREYNETPLPNHFIIDVTNGTVYNVTDLYCPLKKVYCVVNENNIWGNVQRGDAVFTTRFDFTRRFDWQPLFNNSVSSPSNSVQHSLHYLQSGDALKLQNVIEKKLHKKIAKLREHDVTIWNHYISNLLRAQILKAEKNFMHSKTHLTSSSQMIEYSNNFRINGIIQYFSFSSVNEVVDMIAQTKIWNITGSNVEFASCVQVHAYVNQVIAVWIAFVSIVKK